MKIKNILKGKSISVGSTFFDDENHYQIHQMIFNGSKLTVNVVVKNHKTQSRQIETAEYEFEKPVIVEEKKTDGPIEVVPVEITKREVREIVLDIPKEEVISVINQVKEDVKPKPATRSRTRKK